MELPLPQPPPSTLSLDSFYSRERLDITPTQALGDFSSRFLSAGDEICFQNKTKPVTQATVIIGVIAFASSSPPLQ
jgi:hypothetical protein